MMPNQGRRPQIIYECRRAGRMPETLNVSVMYNSYSVHLSPHPSIINEALLGHIDTAQGWSAVTKRGQED